VRNRNLPGSELTRLLHCVPPLVFEKRLVPMQTI
jgi:hypothetical protein